MWRFHNCCYCFMFISRIWSFRADQDATDSSLRSRWRHALRWSYRLFVYAQRTHLISNFDPPIMVKVSMFGCVGVESVTLFSPNFVSKHELQRSLRIWVCANICKFFLRQRNCSETLTAETFRDACSCRGSIRLVRSSIRRCYPAQTKTTPLSRFVTNKWPPPALRVSNFLCAWSVLYHETTVYTLSCFSFFIGS